MILPGSRSAVNGNLAVLNSILRVLLPNGLEMSGEPRHSYRHEQVHLPRLPPARPLHFRVMRYANVARFDETTNPTKPPRTAPAGPVKKNHSSRP